MILRHLKHFLAALMTVLIVGMALLLAYWNVLDGTRIRPIIKFDQTLNLKTEKDVYRAGDIVRVYLSYCKYRDLDASFTTALIDHSLTLYGTEDLPQTGNSHITGCVKDRLVDWETIPPTAYPSTYHFTRLIKYQSNPARIVEFRLQTQNFEIK